MSILLQWLTLFLGAWSQLLVTWFLKHNVMIVKTQEKKGLQHTDSFANFNCANGQSFNSTHWQ